MFSAIWVKTILENNGQAHLWGTMDGNFIRNYAQRFKQTLTDQYKQDWHSTIEESDRFATYKAFKQEHKRENYLTDIKSSKQRKHLTRLRMGITEINNNQRFTSPNHPRSCPFCDDLEDEEHFLLRCPTYNRLRRQHISRHWITLNNVQYTDLLYNDNPNILRDTAVYTIRALALRESNM